MSFITLTDEGGQRRRALVRPEAVEAIVEQEHGCRIYLRGGECLSVRETAAAVLVLIAGDGDGEDPPVQE